MLTLKTQEDMVSLVRRFESTSLPKAEWTHEAHLVVGHWQVFHAGPDVALETLRARIRAYNEAVGTENTDTTGYHETLTRLYVWAIDKQLALHGGVGVWESLLELLRSEVADPAYPLRLYSRARLFSQEARRAWVPPDLVAWPAQEPGGRATADLPRWQA